MGTFHKYMKREFSLGTACSRSLERISSKPLLVPPSFTFFIIYFPRSKTHVCFLCVTLLHLPQVKTISAGIFAGDYLTPKIDKNYPTCRCCPSSITLILFLHFIQKSNISSSGYILIGSRSPESFTKIQDVTALPIQPHDM